jgi:MFS family permease
MADGSSATNTQEQAVCLPRAAAISSRYRWYALGVMLLIYACQTLDRNILSVVIEPIKHEFQASDRAMGVLAGIAFGVAFSVCALPMGYLVDRVNRRNMLAIIVLIWSALTTLSGLATSYWSLLIARMGIGAAESGASPTSMSIVSDYFNSQQRASAIGVYYLSTALGIALSLLVGGYVADRFGWRAAFLTAGPPGFLLSLLLFLTLREPARGGAEAQVRPDAAAPPFLVTLRAILSLRAIQHLLVGVTFATFTTAGILIWAVSFLVRTHGFGLKTAAMTVAMATGIFQSLGTVLVGTLTDRIWGPSLSGRAIMPGILCFLLVPGGVAMTATSNPTVAVCMLCVNCMLLGGWMGPAYSLALSLVAPRMRGTMMSTQQICINLIGSGLGPVFTGTVSDALGGQRGLANAIMITMLFGIWGGTHFMFAARAIGKSCP